MTYLTRAKEEWKIKEKLRLQMQSEVAEKLKSVLGEDKVDVSVELELDFDQAKVEKTEYIPIIKTARQPRDPLRRVGSRDERGAERKGQLRAL